MRRLSTYSLAIFMCMGLHMYPANAQNARAKATLVALPDYKTIGAGFSKNEQKALQVSDKFFQSEQYAEAIKYYSQLTEKHPDNIYTVYQMAECHRQMFQYVQAEASYGKVMYADSVQYPKAVFYYGLMQKMNAKYAYAIHTFDRFITQAAASNDLTDKSQWIERTRREQEGCRQALIREGFLQGNFQFKALSTPVSSVAHDYAPVIMGSDSIIAITSGRMDKRTPTDARLGEAFSDIQIYSLQSDSAWGVAKETLPRVNSSWSDGAGFLLADGTKFYFTSCRGPGVHCAIYVTERKNNQWQKPVRLNALINESNSDSRHPTLTPGGDTLYFVSNREGGYGMNDIWMSFKTAGEEWQSPVNMGDRINTAYNDISPFYYATDRQFFFASDGHVGQGGLDLYYINLSGNSLNQTALNLGPPFNSSRDDAFLVLGEHKGFLASNREGGLGNFDLYTFLIKSKQNDLVTVNPTNTLIKPDLTYLSEFQFEYLSEEKKLLLDRIGSKKEAGRLYSTDLPLTDEEAAFYEKLSVQEKTRAENMVVSLLNRKDTTAMLTEDKFYYEKLSTIEDRHHLQGMTQAYTKAQEDHSTPILTEEDKIFYETLTYQERNQIDRLIAGQLSHRMQSGLTTQEPDTYSYEKLSAADKDRINRMAAERYASKLNQYDEQFQSDDQFFYEKLSSEEKQQLDRAIAARMKYLEESIDASILSEEDHSLYEKLPTDEKARINRMATARHAARMNDTQERFTAEDAFYYEKLAPAERNQLSQVLVARTPASRASMDESQLAEADQFQYDKLSSDEKERVNRIATARYAARVNDTDEQLTAEDKFFYEKLSSEEKAQLDRFVAARMGVNKDGLDLSVLTDEDQMHHKNLPVEEKERIERMAKVQLSATVAGTEPVFTDEDKFYYEKLTPEEKSRMARLMAARTSGGHALIDQSILEEKDVFTYEQLSAQDKERINRMAAARYAARMNGADEKFTETDQFYYEKLSSEDKERMDRLMSARAAAKGMFHDNSAIDGTSFVFKRLPVENSRIPVREARSIASHIPSDESVLNEPTNDDVLARLNASWMGAYKEVKLSGKLMDARTGQPAAGLVLPLVNENGKVIKTTTTNPDGSFQYLNLSLSENLRIRIETPSASLTETQSLYVEDMVLIAHKQTSIPLTFEPAYFDFDSSVLKRTTGQRLDKLVAYYKQNPNIQIELNAFTDEVGSDDYNLRLSNKRGLAVQKYLINKGVLPASLVMYARGKLKADSKTRFETTRRNAKARKVTIVIQRDASESQMSETFVILPDTNLDSIAQKTGVPIETLRKLNSLKTNTVESYRPIRIR